MPDMPDLPDLPDLADLAVLAAAHRRDATAFARLAEAAAPQAWDRPSPVEGWTARDVVGHLLQWLPGFVSGAGVELPAVGAEELRADPVAAWRRRTDDVEALIKEHGTATYASPMLGELPLAVAVDRFYTTDIWMHSWDLARALDLPVDLGEQRCRDVLAGMEPMDELLRSSGQFGPRVPVPADAPAQDRLIGFLGRDPDWRP